MEEKLKPFIEEYSDDFYESIEDIRQYLMKYNKNYREIKNKIHMIMDRNLNIQKLLDETHLEDGLSAGECRDLSQVIVLYNNLQDILEKEIYFKGSIWMSLYKILCKSDFLPIDNLKKFNILLLTLF